MRSFITQSVLLSAPADVLFATDLDPALHAAVTGAPVTIAAAPGSAFSAFGGAITGITLAVIPSRLIVQSWRSTNFLPSDPTLILSFHPEGAHGRIELIHLDVPAQDCQGITEDWEQYYWTPWQRYLTQPQP